MPSFVVIFLLLAPQAWNKLRLESCWLRVLVYAKVFLKVFRAQRHPVGLCQYSFYLFIWETSSKAPCRAYCQYSYFLHLFICFIFFSFIHLHIPWIHTSNDILSYQWISQSFFILKSRFPILKAQFSFRNGFFDTVQVFIFSSFQNIHS